MRPKEAAFKCYGSFPTRNGSKSTIATQKSDKVNKATVCQPQCPRKDFDESFFDAHFSFSRLWDFHKSPLPLFVVQGLPLGIDIK